MLVESFVPSFNECMSACSNWNYHMYRKGFSDVKCTVAVFGFHGTSPGNCWGTNVTKFIPDDNCGVGKLVNP